MPRKAPGKKKRPVPKKYAKRLSLHPMDFTTALDKLLKAKPMRARKK